MRAGEDGMLLIAGPNIMKGYANKPELTKELIQSGWYTTGDIANIDEQGFIHITGRLSRFSKIGGEMVPHVKVEEEINQSLAGVGDDGNDDEEEKIRVCVTAVPDPKKGERLVVLHRPLVKSVEEVLSDLKTAGLPNLFIPSRDSFFQVEQIPLLGTGKLDLKAAKDLALEVTGS